jgi:hypothetical protein
MKYLKKFNEAENSHHEISECMVGATHIISDTNINFVIDGEEYSFTLRESGEGSDMTAEFLPDHDLPFTLTKEMEDQMYGMYERKVTG